MHNKEHNNRLSFDFRRATERELRRLEENYRERRHRREPPMEMSLTRATEGDVEITFRRKITFTSQSTTSSVHIKAVTPDCMSPLDSMHI